MRQSFLAVNVTESVQTEKRSLAQRQRNRNLTGETAVVNRTKPR
jgi:hypothetical protein